MNSSILVISLTKDQQKVRVVHARKDRLLALIGLGLRGVRWFRVSVGLGKDRLYCSV